MAYDNIIVGGGIGGLICGGYLAKAGQKTLILESRERVGGRITSHKFKGYKVSVHGITHHPTMGKEGFWFTAAKDLGAKINMRQVGASAVVWWRGKGWQYKYKPYKDLQGMLEFAVIQSPEPLTETSKKELEKIIKEILDADYMKMCADLDNVFLLDWLNQRTRNPQVHHFFFNLFAQMICMDYADAKEHLSAGKCFTIYRQWLAREGPFCIPQKGTLYDDFIKPFADAFVVHGGQLVNRATVKKVILEKDRVRGVVLSRTRENGVSEYLGKRIIINCPFPSIVRLFDNLPEEIADPIRQMSKAWMVDVCSFSGLGRKITEEPRWVAAQDPKDWRFLLGANAYSNSIPGSAPPGKHLLWTEKIYRLEDFKKRPISQCYEEANQITEEIFPGFREALEVQSHYVHPLLWHHQYSAYKKIPQKSQTISGLYFVGDCTTPQYGTATDAVASTALSVANQILAGQIK